MLSIDPTCPILTQLFRYAHLLEGGRILLVLVNPHGNIEIYIESLSHVNVAIQNRSCALSFHRDKVGKTCLFAVDESKRLLAVYSLARVRQSSSRPFPSPWSSNK